MEEAVRRWDPTGPILKVRWMEYANDRLADVYLGVSTCRMMGSNYYYNYRTSYCLIDKKEKYRQQQKRKRKIFIKEQKMDEKPVFTIKEKIVQRSLLITLFFNAFRL